MSVTLFKVAILYCIFASVYGLDWRIVNGTDADTSEYPFVVSLRNNTAHKCGGSIVNSRYILTAAHCVCDDAVPRPHQNASIQYQINTITNDDYNSIAIAEIKCHKGYEVEKKWLNDIALLRLVSDIPTPFISVTLRKEPLDAELEYDATVIGWGRNATGGTIHTNLQKVDIFVYDEETCKSSTNGPLLSMDAHLCCGVHDNGKGSCQGDSGGPLLLNNHIQVGIVSFGTAGNCGISNTTHPKIMTRVNTYFNWIQENAQGPFEAV